ncbi:MAG: hypothetical protein HY369_01575 [Candidatus Aenigmarchaeota archaeon]|nr:hypothetical protein [Candidatus Aenigmarchaeota archaeon]
MTEFSVPTIREYRTDVDVARLVEEVFKVAAATTTDAEVVARYNLVAELSRQLNEQVMAEGEVRREFIEALLTGYHETKYRIYDSRWFLRLVTGGGSAQLDMERGSQVARDELRHLVAELSPLQASNVPRSMATTLAMLVAALSPGVPEKGNDVMWRLLRAAMPADVRDGLPAMLDLDGAAKEAKRT